VISKNGTKIILSLSLKNNTHILRSGFKYGLMR